MSMLTYILGWPFLAALLIGFIPRNYRVVIRAVALGATLLSMATAIVMFYQFDAGAGGIQFEEQRAWLPSLGISYHVGVDGLNVALVLMGAVVAFAATAISANIKERMKEYYILLMVMSGGILGAFASLDIFLFFFFHEFALIPTFIMIGLWGRGENRNYATFKMTLYLTLGALVALVGLIALYVQAGAKTFDMVALTEQLRNEPLSSSAQHLIFPFLLFGFGILVSLWPFHTWAPLGYGSAPAATAMLHAGVLKKFGLYGLIRIALPLLPEAAQSWMPILVVLALGNILYVGFVAMQQRDLNLLIGNSSVAHMGFVFLGLASLNLIGLTGAVFVMVAHGFLAALTFGLSGYLNQQIQTLDMREMGGLLRRLPFIGGALMVALFAGCGLPGFANFVGEVSIFFGSWKPYPFATGLAVWGALVIGAVYMLRALRGILHGPFNERWEMVKDAQGPWRRLPYALLVGGLLTFGFFPALLTDKITPSVGPIVEMIHGPADTAAKTAALVQTAKE